MEDIEWLDEDKFDFIGFFQVLEHIVEPIRFLNLVYDRLSPDGRVFIEVPNLDDPLRKLWPVPAYEQFYYHEAHLSYFSEKSLRLMLSKCGLEVEDIFFIQDYNFLNNLYWYFNNAPQKSCEFGLNKPYIEFKNEKAGEEVNALFVRMNEEYFRILSKYKLTANFFIVAKKMK